MTTVLFACTHNAGRSQMAAAFFNRLAPPTKAVAVSAGTQPGGAVHPIVITAMEEVGIDLRARRPQLLTPELASRANLLITMGCGDSCPFVPGLEVEDWPLPDPKDRSLAEVRVIRDDVLQRVESLIRLRHLI